MLKEPIMETWHIVLLALACCGALAGIWLFASRKTPPSSAAPMASTPPVQSSAPTTATTTETAAVTPPSYNPSKVGNDSAARPWDSVAVPAGFTEKIEHAIQAHHEEDALLAEVRNCFIEMQRAWDNADITRLRAMLTPDMAHLLGERLLERESQGASAQDTEIIVLEARLLNQEQTDTQRIASVEFSGMVREAQTLAPAPFREIWDMTQSRDDPGACWLVAGVESLQ